MPIRSDPKDSFGKDSLGKDSLGKDSLRHDYDCPKGMPLPGFTCLAIGIDNLCPKYLHFLMDSPLKRILTEIDRFGQNLIAFVQ
jgi:hypothetical protein